MYQDRDGAPPRRGLRSWCPGWRCDRLPGMATLERVRREHGVALILVLFVVSLASVLVISLAWSTHLGSRLNSFSERGFQAEYILKSAISFARVMIQIDKTPADGEQDLWGRFINGIELPPALLGITEPNIRVALEIRPEEAKIPLRALVPVASGPPDEKWRNLLLRFFQQLKFDEDNEPDHTGLFPDRIFTAGELVATLVDYMDQDSESYAGEGFAAGSEGELPKDTYANQRMARVGELSAIPGFTPGRVRRLTPFVTVFGNNRININIAPEAVLLALHPAITADQVKQIVAFRASDEGPFTDQNMNEKLTEIIGDDSVYSQIATMISVRGVWFQVLAKVDYGGSTFFMRAYISRNNLNDLPEIRSVELF